MNPRTEAVRIAIELAELCNLNLVSELHVMRKQYLDVSTPTAFQRAAWPISFPLPASTGTATTGSSRPTLR